MDNLFTVLHGTAMLGMAYIGYHHGNYLKKFINTPAIKPYKEKIGFTPTHFINEDRFCNLTASLSGILIGRILWPIAIPLSAMYIERIHGMAIRKIIKDMRS